MATILQPGNDPRGARRRPPIAATVRASPDALAREFGLVVINGLIGAIPHAGGLLNEVIFETRSRLKARRLEFIKGSLMLSAGWKNARSIASF